MGIEKTASLSHAYDERPFLEHDMQKKVKTNRMRCMQLKAVSCERIKRNVNAIVGSWCIDNYYWLSTKYELPTMRWQLDSVLL